MSKVILRKYGEAATFNFDLFEIDGIDFKVDAVHVVGDTKIMKDEGAETNTTNGFVDEGQGYSIVLTATEMQHARGKVYIVDQGTKDWLDTGITIETYGHASAQHPYMNEGIWDRTLTGATHNVATSAGRRLRGIQEFQGYENGTIWIDTVNGVAGTVDYENGTVENPVDTLADALTIAASLNMTRFTVVNGSTITLASATTNKVFFGINWTLALNGQDISGTAFIGAHVSGIASGTGTEQTFMQCHLEAITHIKETHLLECGIVGTQTVGEAGDYYFDRCHSAIAGTATWVFDFGAAIGNTNLNLRNYSGGVQLENMGNTGTDTASIEGRGQIIEGTCTSGTVAARGLFTTSGITNITLVDGARYDSDTLVDLVWDEPLISGAHNVANSSGKRLRDLKEQGGYEGGFIYIDTVGGTAGSDSFVNGTVDNPVDNIADLNTLSASLNINNFKVTAGSSLTFAAAQEKQSFIGESWTLALGGQSVSGSFFHGADVSGICTGVIKPKFEDCEINGTTMPPGHFDKCGFNGTMIAGSAGDFFFAAGCHSSIAGTGTPVFDYGAAVGATNFNFRGYHGGIKLLNMLTGDNFSHDGDGQIIIDATCTGGTMRISGHQTLTGADVFEAAGGTISDDARYAIDQLEGVGTTYLADVVVAEKLNTLLDINKSLDFTVSTTTRLEYQWLDVDGDPVNITGLTFKFKAVKNAGEASPAIPEVTGTISDAVNGRWYFDVLPTTVFKGRYEIWSVDATPATTTLTKAGGARIETHPRL
jgi:hypothetical protein